MSDILNIEVPDFLDEDTDIIHQRMIDNAPEGINVLAGDIYWDCTRPNADELARFKRMALYKTIEKVLPQTSSGDALLLYGESRGIFINKATCSTGKLLITGKVGTEIYLNDIYTTTSSETKSVIEFKILDNYVIGEDGTAEVEAECLTAGVIGNVLPGTITVVGTSRNGIKSVTNPEAFKGGTDIETEEHYRDRVVKADQEERYSGSDSDYERWCLEVDGVGSAYVVEEADGPGTVKIFILDKNGDTATESLIEATQKYIFPPKVEGKNRGGKAPMGPLSVVVTTPEILKINISANFIFSEDFDSKEVIKNVTARLNRHLFKIKLTGVVKFNNLYGIVASFMEGEEGIDDFTDFKVNNGTSNIVLTDQVAVVGTITNTAEVGE